MGYGLGVFYRYVFGRDHKGRAFGLIFFVIWSTVEKKFISTKKDTASIPHADSITGKSCLLFLPIGKSE